MNKWPHAHTKKRSLLTSSTWRHQDRELVPAVKQSEHRVEFCCHINFWAGRASQQSQRPHADTHVGAGWMGQLDNLVTAISTRVIWSLTGSKSLSASIVSAVHSFICHCSSFILPSSAESWEFVFFERADPIQTISTTNHLLSKIFYAIESHFPWHLWRKTASSSLFFFFKRQITVISTWHLGSKEIMRASDSPDDTSRVGFLAIQRNSCVAAWNLDL